MFSSSGVSPQVGSLITQVSTLLNGVKNSAVGRWITYAQKRTQHGNKSKTITEQNQPTASVVESDKNNPYATLLDEFGLSVAPTELLSQLTSPVSICHCNTQDYSHWRVSHISAESFFHNKHGFSSQSLSNWKHPRLKSSVLTSPFTRLPWQHTSFGSQRRGIQTVSLRRIQQLEERANSEEHNPRAQAEYLRALVSEDPSYVIRRYESGKYAVDDSVKREYLKALVLTDKISHGELDQLNYSSSSTESSGPPSYAMGVAGPTPGTEDNPMYVVMQSQKGAFFKEQVWNTIRFLIGLFLILSVLEAQLQMKMSSNQKEIQPDSVDRKCKFSDVQGVEEAKQELKDVVEFLRSPERFKRLGGKMPTGVLLIGSPGTGKTLLAKAVAGEAGVPFFFCSGSEFDEMFVGVGAARVRNLFAAAREHAPCIVFIDELDAIGGTRVVHDHQPYSRMTLNQLLVELDGFDKSEGIVVIGATNFPEILDKALIRPGRFDTKINVPMPDVKARHDILKVHLKNIEVSEDVDVEMLARGTPGFSGAELANLVNQAAIRAATDGDPNVMNKHLEFAKDKIMMGPERKSAVIAAKNRELVAYHESGHAIVALYTPGAVPVHKATIVPRGQALGMKTDSGFSDQYQETTSSNVAMRKQGTQHKVAQLPENDELNWSKMQLLAKVDVCMGGRVAEEFIFGKENITTGAASDMEQATKIARAMVASYGMSDKIGMLQVHENDKLSPDMQSLIESEVKLLLKESYERAKNIVASHSKEHKRLAEALLQYETLDLEEIKLVIQGKKLARTL